MSTDATNDEVRAFYDRVAPGYAEVLPDTAFEAPLDLGMLDHFTSLLPTGARVLDAGCGTGRMLTALHRRGVTDLEGVDLSPEMIAIARQAHPQHRLVIGDLEHLPYEPSSFDGVLAWYSVIHIPPRRLPGVLDEVARVLRPGGLVLLGFQAGTGSRTVAGASYRGDGTVSASFHSVEAVREALADAGIDVVAAAERDASPGAGHPQGFVIGRRRR